MMRTSSNAPVRTANGVDLERLYACHHDAVLRFFARRTADPQIALDLWAETFAQAFAKRRTFRGTTAAEAEAWLMRIARRQLTHFYRRGTVEQRGLRRMQLERPAASPDVLTQISVGAGLDELRDDLAAALALLSDTAREAIQMRVVDGLEYATVATRLGISEGAARVRVSRGLSTLADLLDGPTTKEART